VLTVLGVVSMYLVNVATTIYVPSRWAVVPPITCHRRSSLYPLILSTARNG
jgi:hypothetical protein